MILIISGCSIFPFHSENVSVITGDIDFSGNTLALCRSVVSSEIENMIYWVTGYVFYEIDIETGQYYESKIELNSYYAHVDITGPSICKTNKHYFISSKQLSEVLMYNTEVHTMEVAGNEIIKAIRLSVSPDESEYIMIENLSEKLTYHNNKTGDTRYYVVSDASGNAFLSADWDNGLAAYYSDKDGIMHIIDIIHNEEHLIDLSNEYILGREINIIKGIKWINGDVLVDMWYEPGLLQISYDTEWKPKQWIMEKYFYMNEDSIFCNADDSGLTMNIYIYSKNDDLIRKLSITSSF